MNQSMSIWIYMFVEIQTGGGNRKSFIFLEKYDAYCI